MKENPTVHTDECLCIHLPLKNEAVSLFYSYQIICGVIPFWPQT